MSCWTLLCEQLSTANRSFSLIGMTQYDRCGMVFFFMAQSNENPLTSYLVDY